MSHTYNVHFRPEDFNGMMIIAHLLAVFLQTAELELEGKTIVVEIADTESSRARGLMERTTLPEGRGMLFVFNTPSSLAFWMKNTSIPLSIGFFNADRKLINTAEMIPPAPGARAFPTYESEGLAQYALEMPQNWFQEHHIQPGMKFTLNDRAE